MFYSILNYIFNLKTFLYIKAFFNNLLNFINTWLLENISITAYKNKKNIILLRFTNPNTIINKLFLWLFIYLFYSFFLLQFNIFLIIPIYIHNYLYIPFVYPFFEFIYILLFKIIIYKILLLFLYLSIFIIKFFIILMHDYIYYNFEDYFFLNYREKNHYSNSFKKDFYKPMGFLINNENHIWKELNKFSKRKGHIFDSQYFGYRRKFNKAIPGKSMGIDDMSTYQQDIDEHVMSVFEPKKNRYFRIKRDEFAIYNKYREVKSYNITKSELNFRMYGEFMKNFRIMPVRAVHTGYHYRKKLNSFYRRYNLTYRSHKNLNRSTKYVMSGLKTPLFENKKNNITFIHDKNSNLFNYFYLNNPNYFLLNKSKDLKITNSAYLDNYLTNKSSVDFYQIGTTRNNHVTFIRRTVKFMVDFIAPRGDKKISALNMNKDIGLTTFKETMIYSLQGIPNIFETIFKLLKSDKYFLVIIFNIAMFSYLYIAIINFFRSQYYYSIRMRGLFKILNYIQRRLAFIIYFSFYIQFGVIPFYSESIYSANHHWKYIIYIPWVWQYWKNDFFYKYWSKKRKHKRAYRQTRTIPFKLFLITSIFPDMAHMPLMHLIFIIVMIRIFLIISHKWRLAFEQYFIYNIFSFFMYIGQTNALLKEEFWLTKNLYYLHFPYDIKYSWDLDEKIYFKETKKEKKITRDALYKPSNRSLDEIAEPRALYKYFYFYNLKKIKNIYINVEKSQIWLNILYIFYLNFLIIILFFFMFLIIKLIFLIFLLFFIILLKINYFFNIFNYNFSKNYFFMNFFENFNYKFTSNFTIYKKLKCNLHDFYIRFAQNLLNLRNKRMYYYLKITSFPTNFRGNYLYFNFYINHILGSRASNYWLDFRSYSIFFRNYLNVYSTVFERTIIEHTCSQYIQKSFAESNFTTLEKRLRANSYRYNFYNLDYEISKRHKILTSDENQYFRAFILEETSKIFNRKIDKFALRFCNNIDSSHHRVLRHFIVKNEETHQICLTAIKSNKENLFKIEFLSNFIKINLNKFKINYKNMTITKHLAVLDSTFYKRSIKSYYFKYNWVIPLNPEIMYLMKPMKILNSIKFNFLNCDDDIMPWNWPRTLIIYISTHKVWGFYDEYYHRNLWINPISKDQLFTARFLHRKYNVEYINYLTSKELINNKTRNTIPLNNISWIKIYKYSGLINEINKSVARKIHPSYVLRHPKFLSNTPNDFFNNSKINFNKFVNTNDFNHKKLRKSLRSFMINRKKINLFNHKDYNWFTYWRKSKQSYKVNKLIINYASWLYNNKIGHLRFDEIQKKRYKIIRGSAIFELLGEGQLNQKSFFKRYRQYFRKIQNIFYRNYKQSRNNSYNFIAFKKFTFTDLINNNVNLNNNIYCYIPHRTNSPYIKNYINKLNINNSFHLYNYNFNFKYNIFLNFSSFLDKKLNYYKTHKFKKYIKNEFNIYKMENLSYYVKFYFKDFDNLYDFIHKKSIKAWRTNFRKYNEFNQKPYNLIMKKIFRSINKQSPEGFSLNHYNILPTLGQFDLFYIIKNKINISEKKNINKDFLKFFNNSLIDIKKIYYNNSNLIKNNKNMIIVNNFKYLNDYHINHNLNFLKSPHFINFDYHFDNKIKNFFEYKPIIADDSSNFYKVIKLIHFLKTDYKYNNNVASSTNKNISDIKTDFYSYIYKIRSNKLFRTGVQHKYVKEMDEIDNYDFDYVFNDTPTYVWSVSDFDVLNKYSISQVLRQFPYYHKNYIYGIRIRSNFYEGAIFKEILPFIPRESKYFSRKNKRNSYWI